MPVRSSTSSVLKWPEPSDVLAAARTWAASAGAADTSLLAIGLFGSYARGNAGVGSDLDLVAIFEDDTNSPVADRARKLPTERLPLPADVVAYGRAEWRRRLTARDRLGEILRQELLWLWRE